jgi:type IX secretion system PorP/SprF family membrane protein
MYATPLYINPAFTGNHECDFRAGVNYRQQAASFTVPFETYTAWGDTRLYPEFLRGRGWFGLGTHFYYDNAGNGDLTKVQGLILAAYSQGFNADNSLYGSLGVGVGFTNRSVNKNNLIYGDEWRPADLQFHLGSSMDPAKIINSSIFYPEFNLGLSLHHVVNENWMYEVGASVSHINTPRESFYDDYIPHNDTTKPDVKNNNKVDRKYIVHATAQHIINDNILIKPEAYFITHEGVNETILGANMVFGTAPVNLYGGLWFRVLRDIIPVVGVEYNGFTLLFSYDINVSKQHYASQYQGAFEFSLVKKFCSDKPSKRKPCNFLEF